MSQHGSHHPCSHHRPHVSSTCQVGLNGVGAQHSQEVALNGYHQARRVGIASRNE